MRQLPGSSLSPEVFKLGFNAMNSLCSLWLNDIWDGLFRFEKIAKDDLIPDNEEEPKIGEVLDTMLDDSEEPVEDGSHVEL